MFVLSKGHAVAAMAAIYADLGYFGPEILRNSRSYSSILNGHPGPILPGVHIATGPMGQGFGVAQGFAIAGRISPRFDSYCMSGDGELQEGPIWEAVMFAGSKKLDNLCLLVDRNNGQLDIYSKTVFPMPDLAPVFRSFGWQAVDVDATQYDGVYAALDEFRYGPRNGKPTAIICNTTKGYGSLSDFFNRHKVAAADPLLDQELILQREQRRERVAEFGRFYAGLEPLEDGAKIQDTLVNLAARHAPGTGGAFGGTRTDPDHGPGGAKARCAAEQKDPLRCLPLAAYRQNERVCRERHRNRGNEGVRAGPRGCLDRLGPGEHQRSGGRHRRRGPTARLERWCRRSQYDADRRGLRGAWL